VKEAWERLAGEWAMKGLTVREAAERLGLSVSLVYALCAAKRIRHERHGMRRGTIRIPEEAIEEYHRSVTVAPAAASPPNGRRFRHLT
jgi:excisionase family DNA binding protein